MGIKPDRDANLTAPTSTPSDRYGDMNAGLEADGARAGGVLKDINAKAESANAGATELAGDLTALESRVTSLESKPKYSPPPVETISGSGWSARRQGKLVVVTVYGATADWTMPEGWRPAATTHAPAAARANGQTTLARVGFLVSGTVSIMDIAAPVYASVMYFAA